MAVYAILQQTNHDFTPAESFGEINLLFPLGVNITNVDVIAKAAREWLHDFDFQEDYFLPVGNPLVVAVVSMCIMEEMFSMGEDNVRMLEWDKRDREYVVRNFLSIEEDCEG